MVYAKNPQSIALADNYEMFVFGVGQRFGRRDRDDYKNAP
jgi:hypothetical protein